MDRAPALAVVLALAAGGAGALVGTAPAAAEPTGPLESTIVVLRAQAEPRATTLRLERAHGFVPIHRYTSALGGFAAALSPVQRERIALDHDVAAVHRDRPLALHDAVPLRAGDGAPPGIRRIGAATATTAHGAARSAVAVIDTGIDLRHPELAAVAGTSCVAPGQPPQDDNGHGTHVAGIIGARNDGKGIVGVAPGTRLYAVKVMDAAGRGSLARLICGLDWVAARASSLGIKVVNVSLGGAGATAPCGRGADPVHDAVCRLAAKGVTVVVAAGNDASPLEDDVPAAYPEVLTVTAFTDTDGRPGGDGPAAACAPGEADDRAASYSSFATTTAAAAHVVSAPGTCILSTWPGGGHRTLSGTSMAAPHAAGAVALCLGGISAPGPCAGLDPAQLIRRIVADAGARPGGAPARGYGGVVSGGY